MKNFESPSITSLDFVKTETVYAMSGNPGGNNFWNNTTGTPDTPSGEWTIGTEWANHNSGSHSELKIKMHNNGTKSGNNITAMFWVDGLKLKSITPGDQCLHISNLSVTGFTLTRSNRHFNPNENIEFVMQATFEKEDGSIGAAGTSGAQTPCPIHCFSYVAD